MNETYDKFVELANKLISKLEKIKLIGKSKIPVDDIITRSTVRSVIIGLGNKFPHLTNKLNDLEKFSFDYTDLSKLHSKGKLDMKSWSDKSIKENAEMAQSDITKIIDYSEKLQSMFDVNDNLEDWVKAKLNHACDYIATVRDYLKFYRDEKDVGTSDDEINEKWSNKYKRSIDCSSAKGFSQKAHCRARKLRQSGKHTNSKPVREIYKEVTDQLLKEFNSSMAMGALKQINNDAQELETMLQPSSQLEDWVKAKLNLAGEYLDDVYHHLDHFGSDGRQLDESWSTKHYWITPSGKFVDAEGNHENWIKKHDPSLVGRTLIDTYENAIAKGYVRVIYDVESKFLTLSNLPNYDFSMSKINRSIKKSIEDFVVDKELVFVATGKGKLIKDFEFAFDKHSELAEQILHFKNINEGWKDLVAASALGLSALKGFDSQAAPIKVSNQIQTVKPGVTQTANKSQSTSDISLDQSFVDYIKRVENASKVGFNKQKNLWFPHKSFEGGSDTIGYGHKIQKGEDFSKGITDAQAEALLKKDLEKAKSQVYKELSGQQLSKKQLEMFIDFVFNMGTLKKFPKFTTAALKNDTKDMKSQFKRFSGGKELKGRNSAFLQRFLTEYFGFNYYI